MTLEQLEQAVGGLATTATGGLLPIADALVLAEEAHPVLALFDHAGRPLHLGRRRRLANADQRLALIAADGGLHRPGCSSPASLCAVHHVTDWHKGGHTDIEGLALVCDACHAQVNDVRPDGRRGLRPTIPHTRAGPNGFRHHTSTHPKTANQ